MNRYLTEIKRLAKGRFARNVAIVATGTAGAQAVTIAFAPIITRLYGPEAFGLLGTFIALVTIVTPIAALCYPIAIVLPKDDNEAWAIGRLSTCIAIVVALVIGLILLVFGDRLVDVLQAHKIAPFMILIPLSIVFSSQLQINQQQLIREKRFQLTARVAVIQSFLINSAKAGIGILLPLAAILVILHVLGDALYSVLLALGARRDIKDKQRQKHKISIDTLWNLAKKYSDFPAYSAPRELIRNITQNMPILILAYIFGPSSAGLYTLCKKVLGKPSLLISKSVGNVFYPNIAEDAQNNKLITSKLLKAIIILFIVGFIPYGVIIFTGPWLFGVLFGGEWIVAGEYARWLTLSLFFQFVSKPALKAIPVLGLQSFLLLFEIFITLLKGGALFAGFYLFKSDEYAIALFSIVSLLMDAILISYVLLKSKRYQRVI